VAPGAGGGTDFWQDVAETVAKARLPLRVFNVDWNHGTGSYVEDVQDQENHRRAAWRLAQKVWYWRMMNPAGKIYLIGHSAGGAIVLGAANYLPANTIDRIILLAPGVSSRYDIRRALCVCREGIDLYSSYHDEILDVFIDFVGTTEGDGAAAAGQVGFFKIVESPMDAWLYTRLHHYPWRQEYGELGNQGGHFGPTRPTFLYHCVLPRLLTP
jgi:pimeloyl-ACP methyl ester carboxylesterase